MLQMIFCQTFACIVALLCCTGCLPCRFWEEYPWHDNDSEWWSRDEESERCGKCHQSGSVHTWAPYLRERRDGT